MHAQEGEWTKERTAGTDAVLIMPVRCRRRCLEVCPSWSWRGGVFRSHKLKVRSFWGVQVCRSFQIHRRDPALPRQLLAWISSKFDQTYKNLPIWSSQIYQTTTTTCLVRSPFDLHASRLVPVWLAPVCCRLVAAGTEEARSS